MITIHHLGTSQSHRIVWLCEELALPYRLVRYERDSQTRLAPPAYRALHPLGTAPVITDGDMVLPESGAIMTYLIEKYGEGRFAVSPDSPDYAEYLFWFHFANGSLMPSLMIRIVLGLSGGSADHPLINALKDRTKNAFALIEERLRRVPYFAGDQFTAADIIMFFPLTAMRIDLARYANLRGHLKRVQSRPAYQTASARADPDVPAMSF